MSSPREYDLFIPLHDNDGTPVAPEKLAHIRQRLVDHFGGLTDMRHSSDGHWRVGSVTFRDEIVIYRVLGDDGREATRFLKRLKEELKRDLRQEDVLIVARKVDVL